MNDLLPSEETLLLTGAFACTDAERNVLRSLGFARVLFEQDERGTLFPESFDVTAIVCNGLFLYHDISLFPRLKMIQLTSVGLDRVPLEKIEKRGIILRNAAGIYAVPMAEHALWGVLQLFRRGADFTRNQTSQAWNKRRDLRELNGCTVCIIGCGAVGREVAVRFKAFGTKLIGVDLFPKNVAKGLFDEIFTVDCLNDVLPLADVVVLTLPLTPETEQMFNSERLGLMKPTATLVNIARGRLVDESALCDVLQSKKLFGAVLDVFETEPLSKDSPLWRLENVVITPHSSFVSEQNQSRLFERIKKNLNEYMLR